MNNLNCVIDISSKAILTFTKSYSCAVAVSQGMINTEPHVIPSSITKVGALVKQFNLSTDHLCSTPEAWLKTLPKSLMTTEYTERRKLATTRATYIHSLEAHLDAVVQRGCVHFDETMMAHLMRAQSSCNPDADYYSYGIIEYANIQNITPKAAYQEITVVIETTSMIKIRAYAWMQLCIRKLNSTNDLTRLSKVWKECWEDVKRCAFT